MLSYITFEHHMHKTTAQYSITHYVTTDTTNTQSKVFFLQGPFHKTVFLLYNSVSYITFYIILCTILQSYKETFQTTASSELLSLYLKDIYTYFTTPGFTVEPPSEYTA